MADEQKPTYAPTRAYRYTGVAGKHIQDGTPLVPGDVVQLTENAAKSFKDRFEPVDTGEKFTVKEFKPFVRQPVEQSQLEPSEEAVQAQADKAEAEQKFGKNVVDTSVRTADSTKGTVKSDPDGTAKKL